MGYRADVLARDPLAYWRLGESIGATQCENQVSGSPLYLNSEETPPVLPTLEVACAAAIEDADTAISFDAASTQHINTNGAEGSVPGASALTRFLIEFWFTEPTAPCYLFHGKVAAGSGFVSISYDGGNVVFVTPGGTALVPTAGIGAGWHHLIAIYENGVTKLYVDAVYSFGNGIVAAADLSEVYVGYLMNPLGGGSLYATCSIDEIAIYDSNWFEIVTDIALTIPGGLVTVDSSQIVGIASSSYKVAGTPFADAAFLDFMKRDTFEDSLTR